MVTAADAVIAAIDRSDLQQHRVRTPVSSSAAAAVAAGEGPEAQAARAVREQQRAALQDALLRKGLAQADALLGVVSTAAAKLGPPVSLATVATRSATPSGVASPASSPAASTPAPGAASANATVPAPSEVTVTELTATWSELTQWADVDELKYLPLRVAVERAHGRPAAALKHLQRFLSESEAKPELRLFHALRRYAPRGPRADGLNHDAVLNSTMCARVAVRGAGGGA